MTSGPFRVLRLLREDLETACRRDPAARTLTEVALTYPGVHAVWSHRVAHTLWTHGVKLPARMLSAVTRTLTGVDIHPAARLGRRVFIDHATGVVIGETAEVGEDVVIFHGVTLGGLSMEPGKRHPSVGSHVLLGAGAKVLGPVRVGDNAKIGANAVVTGDVPAHSVAVGVPARVRPTTRPQEPDADLIVDPNAFAEDPTLYI